MSDSLWPRTTAWEASLSFTISWNLLRFLSSELVMLSNHYILCCPFLLLPSIFPNVRIFSNESALGSRWPVTGASTSASVLPMNIQGWFPLRLTDLISLLELSSVFSSTTVWKHQVFGAQAILITCLPITLQVDALGWLQKRHGPEI